MKEAYDRAMAEANVPQARYQYFDFHNECKGMRYERISNLVDLLEEDLVKKGYVSLRRVMLYTVAHACWQLLLS